MQQLAELTKSTPTPAEAALDLLETIPRFMRRLRQDNAREHLGALTLPQFRVLAKLRDAAHSATELAMHQGVSLPALSRMADTLVRHGMVRREPGRGDRRRVNFSLTEKGRAVYLAARSKIQARLASQAAELSTDERRALQAGLAIVRKLSS